MFPGWISGFFSGHVFQYRPIKYDGVNLLPGDEMEYSYMVGNVRQIAKKVYCVADESNERPITRIVEVECLEE